MMGQSEPAFDRILYWEDVEPGAELPGFSMKLDWTTMALQVHGSQDWNRVHHDPDFAMLSGHDGIFYNTGWTAGMLSRVVTDWMGLQGWVTGFSFQMRGMNMSDDTVSAKGRVEKKELDGAGHHVVTLDVWLENDRAGTTTPAKFKVRLPSRDQNGSGQE